MHCFNLPFGYIIGVKQMFFCGHRSYRVPSFPISIKCCLFEYIYIKVHSLWPEFAKSPRCSFNRNMQYCQNWLIM